MVMSNHMILLRNQFNNIRTKDKLDIKLIHKVKKVVKKKILMNKLLKMNKTYKLTLKRYKN